MYSKIKNISIKKDCVMITSADSDTSPVDYTTYELDWATEFLREGKREQLIGYILYGFLVGEFRSSNDKANRKYLYALTVNSAEIIYLRDCILGRMHDYIREEEEERIVKMLYQNYLEAERADKAHAGKEYVVKTSCGYLVRFTEQGAKFTEQLQDATRYDYLLATAYAYTCGYQKHVHKKYCPEVIEADKGETLKMTKEQAIKKYKLKETGNPIRIAMAVRETKTLRIVYALYKTIDGDDVPYFLYIWRYRGDSLFGGLPRPIDITE